MSSLLAIHTNNQKSIYKFLELENFGYFLNGINGIPIFVF